MKKTYICPTIETEDIEDEDLMLNESATSTTVYAYDPEIGTTDDPGFTGEGELPWDDEGDD